MGKKITALVMGVLFGLALIGAFYMFFVLGIAFGIASKSEILFYASFGLILMGVLAIIGASLIFKNIKITKALLIIPLIYYIVMSVYTIIVGAFSILYLLIIVLILAFGIVPVILAFTIKQEINHSLACRGDIKADKETMKIGVEDK
jgi:hypothetical protein